MSPALGNGDACSFLFSTLGYFVVPAGTLTTGVSGEPVWALLITHTKDPQLCNTNIMHNRSGAKFEQKNVLSSFKLAYH